MGGALKAARRLGLTSEGELHWVMETVIKKLVGRVLQAQRNSGGSSKITQEELDLGWCGREPKEACRNKGPAPRGLGRPSLFSAASWFVFVPSPRPPSMSFLLQGPVDAH